ncbi:uncharacterized protein LOC131156246 isoform X1 [Malania oleifera]|uniref:uncharacterized protein LOC131156246 isoform X1 n=1 Tax=Malania oleifera TaxID=397392 RepID=UPI0025AE8DA3|nr:uncharacterized protein LOC131156246 isoform X1 [Malania oleifera]XP_057965759.1 uncharacterized protein LOC131156246 isoform X2 [Malania oleifera]XP_057965760.1 uncharacterized protein LOC131156246 isoform X1 [Malania oleifera]XP_057965761.1 uncharacterized protein LOC131156246 isoform X1 [Malania oleifera]
MEEAGILEPYELRYSDLMWLCSEDVSSPSSSPSSSAAAEEIERVDSITRAIMDALGPAGPGLLTITGVPNASVLRHNLLPLASKLALLNNEDRKRILKEHGLGSDVPLKNLDRTVSSFAMQLNYVQAMESIQCEPSQKGDGVQRSKHYQSNVDRSGECQENEFSNLGSTFKELGFRMMELGLCIAKVCDRAFGSRELEQSVLESCSAKGRLIHYHSTVDNLIIKQNARKYGSVKWQANHKVRVPCVSRNLEGSIRDVQRSAEGHNLDMSGKDDNPWGNHSNLWQQWHYDYGIFTVLTAPLFTFPHHQPMAKAKDFFSASYEQDCLSPTGSTYLQIFYPNKNNVLTVRAPPESFIVQVGESADVLSKGKLRSTLHSVCRPENLENLSRETFVVFLHPAWSKTLYISDYPMEHCTLCDKCSQLCDEEVPSAKQERHTLTQDIYKMVPPLSSRLKDGMTFAKFSRETTKQYYGGNGLQSNR